MFDFDNVFGVAVLGIVNILRIGQIRHEMRFVFRMVMMRERSRQVALMFMKQRHVSMGMHIHDSNEEKQNGED